MKCKNYINNEWVNGIDGNNFGDTAEASAVGCTV